MKGGILLLLVVVILVVWCSMTKGTESFSDKELLWKVHKAVQSMYAKPSSGMVVIFADKFSSDWGGTGWKTEGDVAVVTGWGDGWTASGFQISGSSNVPGVGTKGPASTKLWDALGESENYFMGKYVAFTTSRIDRSGIGTDDEHWLFPKEGAKIYKFDPMFLQR